MKAVRALIFVLWIVLGGIGDRANAQTNVVTFSDNHLELAVRAQLGITNGAITVSNMLALTNLNAGHSAIASLSGLHWATNLYSADFSGNSVQDISPLAGLMKLKYLELRSNPLTNSETILSGLTNLRTLYLGGTSISNASFLLNLAQLTFLNLDHNALTNISLLAGLPNLKGIDLGFNPLSDIAQVAGFTSVTNLFMSGTAVTNASVFTNLNALTSLTLYGNQVNDLSPFAHLAGLRDLGLSWNPIGNHATLAGFTNLTGLWLAGNSVSNLNFVQGLRSLRALGLSHNKLDDIEGLTGLTNLLAVYLDYNGLTNIAPLTNLPNLSRVQLGLNLLDVGVGSPAWGVITTLQSRGVHVEYRPQNRRPDLWVASSWIIGTNSTASLPFSVSDATPYGSLVLAPPVWTNSVLLPSAGVSGAESSCLLTVSSSANTGTTTIVLKVTEKVTPTRELSTNVAVQVTVMAPQPVAIPDPKLEQVIRTVVNKPAGVLNSLDMLALTNLAIFNGDVTNLSGLQWATNLSVLYLNGNSISNLSVLSTLSQLTSLTLIGCDGVDLSPVAALTNLIGLHLDKCSLTNVAFLANWRQLKYLSLEENRIGDVLPLTGLTNLEFLSLMQNRITDVVPLQPLPKLISCNIELNLLDVTLGSDAMTVIQSLTNRNVLVFYDPQRAHPIIQAPYTFLVTRGVNSSLYFNIWDNGPTDQSLILTGYSSNTNLLNIQGFYKEDEGYWRMVLLPSLTQTGTATIYFYVTNDVGYTADWDIPVTVAAPGTLDGSSLNTSLLFETGLDAPWFGQAEESHDAISAARASDIDSGYTSWLQTTLSGPGTLSFWWKVSSATNKDSLAFYVNGELRKQISGEVDWTQQLLSVPPGMHALEWRYVKGPVCCGNGADAGWLDQVSYTPKSWLELSSPPSNGLCQLILHPVPGYYHQLLSSTNLKDWIPVMLLPPTNSSMAFSASTANSPARFYRLCDIVPGSIWFQNFVWDVNQVRMEFHSPAGLRFRMQYSTNMVQWLNLGLVTNSLGVLQYTNTFMPGTRSRFYRAQLLP